MMKDVIAEMIEVLRRHRVEAVIDTAELKVCSGEISFRCKGFPLKDGKTRRKEERARAATLFMFSKDVSDANMWAASNFIRGAEWADRTMIDKACEWIKEHIDIPYEGRMIDGEPEAADYIEWAKERLRCAEEVAESFRKAMEE